MQTEVARMHFSRVEAFAQFMTQYHSVSQAQFTAWFCKERTTDLRVIIRVSVESLVKTLRLISLVICAIISMT
jgi:hypothetical protein